MTVFLAVGCSVSIEARISQPCSSYAEDHGCGRRREVPQHEMWRFDDASQWEALWTGEDAFWKNAANIRAAGLSSILTLQQVSAPDSALRVPRVTREKGSKGHQHFRIAIPKGIQGLSEKDRATLQAWLSLVDWSGRGDVDKNG